MTLPRKKNFWAVLVAAVAALFGATAALAHEAYVLTPAQFHTGLARTSFRAFTALADPHNLGIFFAVAIGTLIGFSLSFVARHTRLGLRTDTFLGKYADYGLFFIRISLGVATCIGAALGSFLGPEIPFSTLPLPDLFLPLAFAAGVLLVLGLFTEYAAAALLVTFLAATTVYGSYLLTYVNYLGEIAALFLFGSHFHSLDRVFFGERRRYPKYTKFEPFIIRATYGLAIVYTAIAVKLLHPDITLAVVNQYNLTQFHWLFPSDPLLVALGAGLAELLIGFLLIIGLEVRVTVLVSLFYITLSLFFFRESVWPHLILYGVSFQLILNGAGPYSVDEHFRDKMKNKFDEMDGKKKMVGA